MNHLIFICQSELTGAQIDIIWQLVSGAQKFELEIFYLLKHYKS